MSCPSPPGCLPHCILPFPLSSLLTLPFTSPDHGAVCHDRGGSCCNQGHGKITGSQVNVTHSPQPTSCPSSFQISFPAPRGILTLPGGGDLLPHLVSLLPRVAVVAAVILKPAEAPSPSLAQLWPGPWLDDSSYTIYLTFYFGFPHTPLNLSGSPCPSSCSLGQE